jgi:small subunit ribosomal protein S7
MPRRRKVIFKRDVGVDPRFGSELVQRFVNVVMWRGKKNAARKIVYEAFDELAKKVGGSDDKALESFRRAFEKVAPAVEVRSRRVGGSVYQIPRPVAPERARILAFRWLITAAAARTDKTMGKRIARELLEILEDRGNALKKKLEVVRMAEANRAFSHYGW